jgi:purine-binding chemotaxis protein CheW
MQENQQTKTGTSTTKSGLTYVIVRIKHQRLAICASAVRQLLLVPKVSAVPMAPPEVRGIINVRGQTMPLVDLRIKLGLPSLAKEAAEMDDLLNQREQDHRNWLTELEASVNEKRPFKLTRDPHQCKFGKWYDSYKPENHSVAFVSIWRSLDLPHRQIHAIADHVADMVARNDFDAARALIEDARKTHLQDLIKLFTDVRAVLEQTTREVAILLCHANRQIALSADEVTAIEVLNEEMIKPLSEVTSGTDATLTPSVVKREGSSEVTLILDVEPLFECASSAVRAAA